MAEVPLIIQNHDRKPVTCDRCSTVWWVAYQEAVQGMQEGRMWIKHRQVRTGENIMNAGKWEDEPYLAGICINCDHGVNRPHVEWETSHIAQRSRHFFWVVDPENAISYAIEEYTEEYMRTFQPEFLAWWKAGGWAQQPSPLSEVDFSLLPPEFLGVERGLADGSPFCPHVQGDWELRQ